MDKQPCAWCYYARMRTDICGIYCTGGFSNPDGQCEHFKDYDEWKGRLKMTRDEYLENHDAHEGAEEPISVTRCPICGSDECEVFAIRDYKVVGCDCCTAKVVAYQLDIGAVGCACCNAEDVEEIYFRHENGKITEIVGCDRCIREVERWRWEAQA